MLVVEVAMPESFLLPESLSVIAAAALAGLLAIGALWGARRPAPVPVRAPRPNRPSR